MKLMTPVNVLTPYATEPSWHHSTFSPDRASACTIELTMKWWASKATVPEKYVDQGFNLPPDSLSV